MPALTLSQLRARAGLAISSRLPDRPVVRTVRGVQMTLPRRHGLPYYAAGDSPYAQNLVDLARELHAAEGDLCLLDVGANIGDSILFVRDRVPCTAVCVEPDPAWQYYLRANVGSLEGVAVEAAALLAPEAAVSGSLHLLHEDVGTSRLESVDDGEGEGVPAITTAELLERHPQLSSVRLIKSDTDGYDVMLVPSLATTFGGSRPVIFFEFDPRPTVLATPDLQPEGVWQSLAALGYERALVWENTGRLVGPSTTRELIARSAELGDGTARRQGYEFWDVAVAHRDDAVGLRVLERLASGT